MDNINKIKRLLNDEKERQESEIDLIASENYASQDVLDACAELLLEKERITRQEFEALFD